MSAWIRITVRVSDTVRATVRLRAIGERARIRVWARARLLLGLGSLVEGLVLSQQAHQLDRIDRIALTHTISLLETLFRTLTLTLTLTLTP